MQPEFRRTLTTLSAAAAVRGSLTAPRLCSALPGSRLKLSLKADRDKPNRIRGQDKDERLRAKVSLELQEERSVSSPAQS